MSSAETKNIIKKYYKQKISKLTDKQNEVEDRYIEDAINKFNEYKEKIGLNWILIEINEEFNTDFDITLSRYKVKGFTDTKEYTEIQDKIHTLFGELDNILFVYESYPKASKEYKEVIEKINKIIEGNEENENK